MNNDYFIYIVTNPGKTVLYTGVTNDLKQRIVEHYLNRGKKTFAGKYYCYHLLYYERFELIEQAITREKEIKDWTRQKKIQLIKSQNPTLGFLNKQLFEQWPPSEANARL